MLFDIKGDFMLDFALCTFQIRKCVGMMLKAVYIFAHTQNSTFVA